MVIGPRQAVSKIERLDVGNDSTYAVLGDKPRCGSGKHSKVPPVLGYVVDILLGQQLQRDCIELWDIVAAEEEWVLVFPKSAKTLGEVNVSLVDGMTHAVRHKGQSMLFVMVIPADMDFDLQPALGVLSDQCRVYRSDESLDSSSICINNVSVVLGDKAWWGPGICEPAKYVSGDAGIHVRSLFEKLSKVVPRLVTGVTTGPCEDERSIPSSRVCPQRAMHHHAVASVCTMHIDVGGTNPVIQHQTTTGTHNITIVIGSAMLATITLTRARSKENALHGIFDLSHGRESAFFGVSPSAVEGELAAFGTDLTGLSVNCETHVLDMRVAREWHIRGKAPTLYNIHIHT